MHMVCGALLVQSGDQDGLVFYVVYSLPPPAGILLPPLCVGGGGARPGPGRPDAELGTKMLLW
jgi:hypothetical protein